MDPTVQAAIIGVGGVALGGAFTVAGTVLGAWLGRKQAKEIAKETGDRDYERMKDQRMWEARRVAYSAILAPCAEMSRILKLHDDSYNGPDANPHSYDTGELSELRHKNIIEAYKNARLAFEQHAAIISDEFRRGFDVMVDGYDEFSQSDDTPPEYAQKAARLVTKVYSNLMDIAKTELG